MPHKKLWSTNLSLPNHSTFAFKPYICLPDISLRLSYVHLEIAAQEEHHLQQDDDAAPVPVMKQNRNKDRIPGCALQVSVEDAVSKKRRKFVISVLSSRDPQKPLNLVFDSDQLKTLSIQIVGRPHLDAKKCRVNLIGEFSLPYAFGRELSGALRENDYKDRMKQLRMKRILEQDEKENDEENGAPSKKRRRTNQDDDSSDEEESESEDDSAPKGMIQTGPRNFLNNGVSIFELITGHGRKAKIGDRIRLCYKGKLDPTRAKSFDKATLAKPYEFTLGSKKVIPGINHGVEGMCQESMRELIIPSHLGFGQSGLGDKVPPNATLYYDVTLKEIIPKKKWKKEQAANQKLARDRQRAKQLETKRLLQVGNKIKL